MITPYGRAHPLRVLRRSILSTEAPEDIVRRAMEIYDFEKSYLQQPEEVIDEVEQMLGMKEIQWPSLNFRLGVIRGKLHVSLEAILRLHGFVLLFAFIILNLANVLAGIKRLRSAVRIKRPVFKLRHQDTEKNPLLFPNGYRFHTSSP